MYTAALQAAAMYNAQLQRQITDDNLVCHRTRLQQSGLFQKTCSLKTLVEDSWHCLHDACAALPIAWHRFPLETCFPRQQVPGYLTASLRSNPELLCCQ